MTNKSKPVPRLYGFSAHITYHTVICAMSLKDAKAEIDTWEECWPSRSDAAEVGDVDLFDVRDLHELTVDIAEDEAHEVTADAKRYLRTGGA